MEHSKINLYQLGMKAKTKNEMYRFLTFEVEMYLPPQKEKSIYFVRSIIQNKKRVCKTYE